MITSIPNRSGAANTSTLISKEYESKSTAQPNSLQVVAERMDAYNSLEQAFGKHGWSFYPLTNESFLAVHRRWQMHHVCPDLRAARALLRRIGGAA